MRAITLLGLAGLCAAPAVASDAWRGAETTFQSPNGLTEHCVRIAPIPGGIYSDGDFEDEAALCAIDLYAPDVAL